MLHSFLLSLNFFNVICDNAGKFRCYFVQCIWIFKKLLISLIQFYDTRGYMFTTHSNTYYFLFEKYICNEVLPKMLFVSLFCSKRNQARSHFLARVSIISLGNTAQWSNAQILHKFQSVNLVDDDSSAAQRLNCVCP
jgi:hypothetical protein